MEYYTKYFYEDLAQLGKTYGKALIEQKMNTVDTIRRFCKEMESAEMFDYDNVDQMLNMMLEEYAAAYDDGGIIWKA